MSDHNQNSTPKTAVILLNMGGPQSNEEVHPYLKELFQDRELLKLPLQKILGNFIAWRRTPKIQQRYAEIGQFSPTLKIMEDQGLKISQILDKRHPQSAPHVCVSGFRYSEPRTGRMLETFQNAEPQKNSAGLPFPTPLRSLRARTRLQSRSTRQYK